VTSASNDTSAIGPSRHFACVQQLGRFRREADIAPWPFMHSPTITAGRSLSTCLLPQYFHSGMNCDLGCGDRSATEPISFNTILISASISATSCGVRCGRRCETRLGTANIPALTVRNTPNHSASTSAASTSDPRAPAPDDQLVAVGGGGGHHLVTLATTPYGRMADGRGLRNGRRYLS
jgi:hypothetical protein